LSMSQYRGVKGTSGRDCVLEECSMGERRSKKANIKKAKLKVRRLPRSIAGDALHDNL
jgi:hypothetical protein